MNIVVYNPRHEFHDPNNPFTNLWGAWPYLVDHLYSLWCSSVTYVDWNYVDSDFSENWKEVLNNTTAVLVTIIWPSIIPIAFEQIKPRVEQWKKVIFWWQWVKWFSDEEWNLICKNSGFDTIFREHQINEISQILSVEYKAPVKEEMVNTLWIAQIPNAILEKYISKEISIYLSDGCSYSCDFCIAERTRKLEDGTVAKVKEKYRNLMQFERELTYYVEKAKEFWIWELSFYVSNLDLFQTPEKLNNCASIIHRISVQSGIKIHRRGLSTFQSVNLYNKKFPDWLQFLHESWLTTVWCWSDWFGKEVWEKIHKKQNTEELAYNIPELLYKFNIKTELLMVFCHPWVDTKESIRTSFLYLQKMYKQFQCIPRLHIAKSAIPGSTGERWWHSRFNKVSRESLLQDPSLLSHIDFLAMPNKISHPNKIERGVFIKEIQKIVRKINTRTFEWVLCPAQLHYAIDPSQPKAKKDNIKMSNMWKYDH